MTAFRRAVPAPPPAPVVTPQLDARPDNMRTLVAAAASVRLDAGSVIRTTLSDQDWQREAWRQLDINGELRFAANRHAAALSRCRIYVAEVDELGDPGREAEDTDIQSLGTSLLGSASEKGENIRLLGLDFYVGGEAYIVAEGATNPNKDIWYIVTANQIRKTGSQYKVRRPDQLGGGWYPLKPGTDLLIRAWTPHPRDSNVADSPTRSVLPVLREIERLSQLTFSQIDSRLISAGLLLFPAGVSFPKANGEAGGIDGLMEMVLEVAKAQLTGAGTAAGLVPIFAEVPEDAAFKPEHLKFETPLTGELKEKLDHAIRRLATGLDIAPEELLGQGSSNHWSAWAIDESGIKLFIEPVMARICAALTQGYLIPALKSMNIDPEKYTLWYDASPLTVRPNRFEDALQLYTKGEISGEEMRKAGNFSEDAAPDKKQLAEHRAWAAVQLDPTLLQQKAYADLLGLPVSQPPQPSQPALPGGDATPGMSVPGERAARNAAVAEQLGIPSTESGGASPAQQGLTASGALPGAEQMVLRALELAGSRMLDRRTRGAYTDVPKHLLHTRIHPTDHAHARRLLDGAFTHAGALASHFSGLRPVDLENLLVGYCTELLVRGYAHETALLETTLSLAAEAVQARRG